MKNFNTEYLRSYKQISYSHLSRLI